MLHDIETLFHSCLWHSLWISIIFTSLLLVLCSISKYVIKVDSYTINVSHHTHVMIACTLPSFYQFFIMARSPGRHTGILFVGLWSTILNSTCTDCNGTPVVLNSIHVDPAVPVVVWLCKLLRESGSIYVQMCYIDVQFILFSFMLYLK